MHKRAGFTLLELSLVIVIIALLAGAIMVGETMLRAAQLRGAVTEMQKYTQAISNFKDKYYALPGDFSGGTALWGAIPSGTSCDGNGNGSIEFLNTQGSFETLCAWWQLQKAGQIDGNYAGVPDLTDGALPSYYNGHAGYNVPASQLTGGLWVVGSATIDGSFTFAASDEIQFIYVNGDTVPNLTLILMEPMNNTGPAGIMTPAEQFQMDSKIDDGLPATGKLVAISTPSGGTYSTCFTNSGWTNYYTNQYNIADTNKDCVAVFKTGL